jgi:NAD(P)-dependent dehydrogenase (short-subunit alcohol dehydrogenase family)
MTELSGKTALITGSGQGIGRAIALAMAEAGADIAVIDRNPDTARAVAEEVRGLGRRSVAVPCDVSQRDQVESAVATTISELGGVDILVNNAHDLRDVDKSFMETDEAHLRKNLESGFFGMYYFMQECYPSLRERRGAVINIGSGAGVYGMAKFFSYGATKEAMRAATRVTAREWGPDGIRVNAICPAAVDTPSMTTWLEANKDPELTASSVDVSTVPLGRNGTAADIGPVAVFLAGPAAGFITGHTLMVDGGSSMDAGR